MNDTVVADDVCGNDGRATNVNLAIGNLDIDRLPVDGCSYGVSLRRWPRLRGLDLREIVTHP